MACAAVKAMQALFANPYFSPIRMHPIGVSMLLLLSVSSGFSAARVHVLLSLPNGSSDISKGHTGVSTGQELKAGDGESR